MKQILQVFGGGVSLDVAEVLTHWLGEFVIKNDTTVDSSLKHLIRLLEDNKTSAVTNAIKDYLYANPSCVYGQLVHAALCLKNSHLNEAAEALQQVYRLQPNHALALYALGHIYERTGQEENAIVQYQDCLKYKDSLELPLQRLAAIYAKQGRFEDVIRLYTQLYHSSSNNLSIQTILGHLYIATSDYQIAEDVFNSAILTVPSGFAFQDLYLDGLMKEDDLVDAVDYIDQKIEDNNEIPELWSKKGDILVQLGATSEAIAAYRQALQISPAFLEVGVKLGTLYMRDDHYLPAIDTFLQAMEVNEQLLEAYMGIALCHQHRDDTAGTLASMTSALMILPNSAMLFTEIGKIMFRIVFPEHCSTGVIDLEPNEAMLMEALIQQVNGHPGNPLAYYHLGLFQLRTTGPAAAGKSFQTCQGLYSDYHRAHIKSILCQHALGETQAALGALEVKTIPDRESLHLHYETGVLYWNHVKLASAMLNLSHQLSKSLTGMDTSAIIAGILESIGVIDPVDAVWDGLQETLLGAETMFGLS